MELKDKLKAEVDAGQAIIAAAQAADRGLTEDEGKKIDEHVAAARDVKAQIEAKTKDGDRRAQLEEFGQLFGEGDKTLTVTDTRGTPVGVGGGKTLGEQFIQSEQYKTQRQIGFKGDGQGAWAMPGVEVDNLPKAIARMEQKTVLTEGAGSGSTLLQPDVQPGILPLLFRRLTIADLIPQGETNGITVRYLSESSFTNAAATVAEGATKPESTLVFVQTDEPVRKIAHILPVTEEMLDDVPAIRDYINGRLTLGVLLTEEVQLLSGTGTPPDLTGILNRAGLQTAQPRGTDNNADAIYKQVVNIAVNAFITVDSIVINPSNWQTIRLGKDAQGQYYGGGPFAQGPFGPELWGLRVVVTPAISAGTALVGAFSQAAQIFRRGGMTLAASNSHNDFFYRNQVALRAEERLALAVYRPAGFGTVTGLA
jgi:HK97 family phage major capsid protein